MANGLAFAVVTMWSGVMAVARIARKGRRLDKWLWIQLWIAHVLVFDHVGNRDLWCGRLINNADVVTCFLESCG